MTKLDTLKKQTAEMEAKLEETTARLKEMKAEIERLENGWEMKCPYEDGDEYFALNHRGSIIETTWNNHCVDEERFEFGNVFRTEQEIQLEIKRRKLLTRFRAFRDECNGDWEADWTNGFEDKFFISFNIFSDTLDMRRAGTVNGFYIFGYFKNEKDIKRAIELFGDEIKELFVEKRLANENN